jgi:hypothetical protein
VLGDDAKTPQFIESRWKNHQAFHDKATRTLVSRDKTKKITWGIISVVISILAFASADWYFASTKRSSSPPSIPFSNNQWQEYDSVIGSFKVRFPNPPNETSRDVNGTIATASFAAFQGGRAIDYVISMSGGSSIKGHDILVGHNLYVMLIVYKLENYSDSDYSKFINSFRLQ